VRGYANPVDEMAVAAALKKWIATAEAAREREETQWGTASLSGWANRDDANLVALREREHQIRQILKQVLKLDHLPVVLDGSSGGMVWVMGGIEHCQYALGVIQTEAETRAMLGPAAPTMTADALHPEVWIMAAGLWEAGHFRVAVQKAATHLNGSIQDKVNRRDVSDRELVQQAFSTAPPQPGKPRLWWPGNSTDRTVVSMREGILTFSQGVFLAIRNVTTHTTEELPRQQAFEMLAAISLLARWVDSCELVEG